MAGSSAPVNNALWRPFWDAAAQDRLTMPHCQSTGRAFWPPSAVSPFVTGGAVDWREVAPTGTLVAQIVYRRGFLAAFKPLLPYGCGLVELDCGPRVQVHIARPDAPDAPVPGQSVTVIFRTLIDGDPPVLGLVEGAA